MKLSPVQKTIVETKGNLIVRASAGTGKTHTMVNKIVNEIDLNKTHKVVAAITFTIKAAQEIRDRLSVDVSQHFIGTNNSFAIEEIVKPFMKDVYGEDYDIDMDTDYSVKIETFDEGLERLAENNTLYSYRDNKKNFIFELAQKIVEQSVACKLYLQAKYFKIYIDEYQDCDKDMHKFFMYLCDMLNIETFIVGDEKQSIYIWRGAYPKAFNSIWEKTNFTRIFMGDNFRSCQQIQNYTNLLCEETRFLYSPTTSLESIILINSTNEEWALEAAKYLDSNKSSALLRYKKVDAERGASLLTDSGIEHIYIPLTPIADITTNTAWLYSSIAKHIILDDYSVYDLISEIPVEGESSKKTVSKIRRFLDKISVVIEDENYDEFEITTSEFAEYLGYEIRKSHVKKLFSTIVDPIHHSAFKAEQYKHICITFHSSKGLEFEQTIVFAEDYKLTNMSEIYNHYVATSRAKSKLIIIKTPTYYANTFQHNLDMILSESGLSIEDIVTII